MPLVIRRRGGNVGRGEEYIPMTSKICNLFLKSTLKSANVFFSIGFFFAFMMPGSVA